MYYYQVAFFDSCCVAAPTQCINNVKYLDTWWWWWWWAGCKNVDDLLQRYGKYATGH